MKQENARSQDTRTARIGPDVIATTAHDPEAEAVGVMIIAIAINPTILML